MAHDDAVRRRAAPWPGWWETAGTTRGALYGSSVGGGGGGGARSALEGDAGYPPAAPTHALAQQARTLEHPRALRARCYNRGAAETALTTPVPACSRRLLVKGFFDAQPAAAHELPPRWPPPPTTGATTAAAARVALWARNLDGAGSEAAALNRLDTVQRLEAFLAAAGVCWPDGPRAVDELLLLSALLRAAQPQTGSLQDGDCSAEAAPHALVSSPSRADIDVRLAPETALQLAPFTDPLVAAAQVTQLAPILGVRTSVASFLARTEPLILLLARTEAARALVVLRRLCTGADISRMVLLEPQLLLQGDTLEGIVRRRLSAMRAVLATGDCDAAEAERVLFAVVAEEPLLLLEPTAVPAATALVEAWRHHRHRLLQLARPELPAPVSAAAQGAAPRARAATWHPPALTAAESGAVRLFLNEVVAFCE